MSTSEDDIIIKNIELDSENSTEKAAQEPDAASSIENTSESTENTEEENTEKQPAASENADSVEPTAEETPDSKEEATTTETKEDSNGNNSADNDIEIISAETVPDDIDNKVLEPDTRKYHVTKGDIVRYVILALAVAVFIFAGYKLAERIIGNRIQKQHNEEVNSECLETTDSSDVPTTTDEDGSYGLTVTDDFGNVFKNINPTLSVKFENLFKINPRAVGYLEVPSLKIQYPIVQGDDNEFYLHHDIQGNDAWSGAIYLDYRSSTDMTDIHTIIYGHHMDDGTMFANLPKYDSESFFKENQEKYNNYVYVYLPDVTYVYQMFCITDVYFDKHPEAFTRLFSSSFTERDFLDYIKGMELYDTGIEAKDTDTLLTLFTCQADSSSMERHLVHTKLIATIKK